MRLDRVALPDDAYVVGRTAHIGEEGIVDADLVGQELGADDAGHRAGLDRPDRCDSGFFSRNRSPGTLGEEHPAGKSTIPSPGLNTFDVAVHERADVGIHDRRGGPLVLPQLRIQFRPAGYE